MKVTINGPLVKVDAGEFKGKKYAVINIIDLDAACGVYVSVPAEDVPYYETLVKTSVTIDAQMRWDFNAKKWKFRAVSA